MKEAKTMFAVIKTGGKQYRVSENDKFTVEKLEGEAGSTIEFTEVLMIGEEGGDATVGAPLIEGAVVSAELVTQTRGDKVIIFKKKRRQNYRRTKGHRQDLTLVRITGISASGAKKKAAPKKAAAKAADAGEEKKAAPKKAAAKKPAAKKPAAKKTTTEE